VVAAGASKTRKNVRSGVTGIRDAHPVRAEAGKGGAPGMLKIIHDTEGTEITRVSLYGRFTGEYLAEVAKALTVNGSPNKALALDLMNVTFVDRVAMEFLCSVKSRNIKVENLPSYVARWIKQETSNESANYKALDG